MKKKRNLFLDLHFLMRKEEREKNRGERKDKIKEKGKKEKKKNNDVVLMC
jgi:hypothetical protein